MSKILLCWELGGGLGHLVPLKIIGDRLCEEGHEVIFGIRDIANAADILDSFGNSWFPIPTIRSSPARPPKSNPEVLMCNGYRQPNELFSLLRAWNNFLRLHKPDVILSDSSITAVIAAKIARIPCLRIGSGFFDPDWTTEFPSFTFWDNNSDPLKHSIEAECLQNLNKALSQHCAQRYDNLIDIYQTPVLYKNWIEANPFGPHHPELHIGTIESNIETAPAQWQSVSGKKVFGYLRHDHPSTVHYVEELIRNDYNVSVYISTISPGLQSLIRTGKLFLHNKPVDLDSTMEADIIMGNGGNVMIRSLARGKRVLATPFTVEQYGVCLRTQMSELPVEILSPTTIDILPSLENLFAKPTKSLVIPEDNVGIVVQKLFDVANGRIK